MRGKSDDDILRYRILCDRLRAARLEAGLSQEAAAAALSRPQSYVAKTERGERRVDLLEAQAFILVYGLNANTLFAPLTHEERERLKAMQLEQQALKRRWRKAEKSTRRGGDKAR